MNTIPYQKNFIKSARRRCAALSAERDRLLAEFYFVEAQIKTETRRARTGKTR